MRFCLSVVVALGLSAALPAQAPSGGASLLVLAKSDLTLSIVDPATLKVIGKAPSGPDPHEVVASTDGRVAYVSNYGGGSMNTISVIDLVDRKPLPPINLGALRGPHGLVFVAGKLWFTAEGAKVVGRYDPATREVDLVIGTGQDRTHMLFVTEDARRIITSNVSSATLTMLELGAGGRGRGGPGGPPPGAGDRGGPPPQPQRGDRGGPPPAGAPGPGGAPPRGGGPGGGPLTNWAATVVPVGRGAEGFDVSPDGREIWAANAQDGTISVVDVATRKVTQTIQANVTGANRLKFTPDGSRVLVSSLSGPEFVFFDAATKQEGKRLPIGKGAAGIQIQPDGARAFVSCTPDNYVAVIDLKTLEVTSHLEAGTQPDGLAWVVRR